MLLALDLDGTLEISEGRLAPKVTESLETAGNHGIIRVLITGRNLYSLSKIIDSHTPLDYVCYASGAAILSWPKQKVLRYSRFPVDVYQKAKEILEALDCHFFIQAPLPESHHFWTHTRSQVPPDYNRRLDRYKDWRLSSPPQQSSQFIIIHENENQRAEVMEQLQQSGLPIHLIRSTSPMDHKTPWLEVFPRDVNKGTALEFLMDQLGISREETFALGNDWNDMEMMQTAGKAWVVPSSPPEMKRQFPTAKGGNSALEYVIDQIIQ